MTVVIDASAAIEIVLNRGHAAEFSSIIESARKVYAPDLYIAEITNVLWKYQKAGYLSRSTAQRALQISVGLVDEYTDMQDFIDEVLNASIRFEHPAYDMFYLVLSRRTGSGLLTLDKRFSSIAETAGIEVIS